MSKKENINLPGTGGLFRVQEGEGTGFKLKPEHVVGMCAAVIAFEALLYFYGGALF